METRYKVINLDTQVELLKRGTELSKYKEYKTIEDINKDLLETDSH